MSVERKAGSGSNWPRRRLIVRSVISATLPVGWTWAAITALIPYLWMGRGAGTGTDTLLGATRGTWLSLHVWSSIAMLVLTMAHLYLNRRGAARSYRVVSGLSNTASSADRSGSGLAWVGVVLLVAISIGGGYWFASVDDTHASGRGRQVATAETTVADAGASGFGNGRH